MRRSTQLLVGSAAVALCAATVFLLLRECPRPHSELPTDALFSIDGVAYREADLAEFLGRPAQFATEQEARRAIAAFIDHEVLVAAARRDTDESIEDPRKRVSSMVAREASRSPVREEDVEAFYAEHRLDFVRPPSVRLAFFRVAIGDDELRARELIDSMHIQAQIDRRPDEFLALIARGEPGVTTGVLGSVDCAALDGDVPLPRDVIEAGCALRPWAFAGPMESDGAYYLLRKTASSPGRNRTLERERDRIETLLERRAQDEARRVLADRLRSRSEVFVAEEAIPRLIASPTSRSEPAASGAPPRPPGLDG